jgi:murein DD-endopeptidase MepM/ murein hydrolase activator NlpD
MCRHEGTELLVTASTPAACPVPRSSRAPLRLASRPCSRSSATSQNALRAAAFEDSVALQYRQISQLRALITGDLDSLTTAVPVSDEPTLPEPAEAEAVLGVTLDDPPTDRRDHEQPALSLRWLDAGDGGAPPPGSAAEAYLASLRLPALPPVDGVVSRGFSARSGHFGVDFALDAGSPVRAVGDGYVVFADWTHEGGYVIAVQHTDGYLSVYKHNARLLARVGDHVRSRETIALSGNTGEITSGPHLHFELWRNGLAQDPRTYLVNS